MKDRRTAHISIHKINFGEINKTEDKVAVEEPLQIQLEYSTASGRMQKNIAVTMRTPGNDEELAAGFLFTEGIIKNGEAISEIKRSHADENIVQVILKEDIIPALGNAARNFYTTSSCGVCGKASIDAINTISVFAAEKDSINVNAAILYNLQDTIKEQQHVFEDTGGIHASALFDCSGKFIMLREDVGRHNALDKIIGAALMKNELPLNNYLLFLSGRASFELVQKAVMAGIKVIAAVGAPSSLAVEMAKENNITLIGFLKSNRFNIYSGKERIRTSPQPSPKGEGAEPH
jgi:FdhD protein